MKPVTGWKVFGLTAMLLIVALPALAVDTAAAGRPPLPGCNDARMIARYLGLSPEQREDWQELREALHATVRPLLEQIAPLRESLATELDKPAPDACTAGGFVVDIDEINDQIVEAREEYEADFEALLTPEQLRKWEALQTVCRAKGITVGEY